VPKKQEVTNQSPIPTRVLPEGSDANESVVDSAKIEAEKYNKLGMQFLESGSFQDAIGPFIKAANLDPNNPVCLTALGYSYYRLDSYKEAIAHLTKAINLDTNNVTRLVASGYSPINVVINKATVLVALGYSHLSLGSYKEAVDPYFRSMHDSKNHSNINRINHLINDPSFDSEKQNLIIKFIIPLNAKLIKNNLMVKVAKMNKADALVQYTELNTGLTKVLKDLYLRDAVKLYREVYTDEALKKACLLTENDWFTKEEKTSISNQIEEPYTLKDNYINADIPIEYPEEKTAQERFGEVAEVPIAKESEKQVFRALKNSIRNNDPTEEIVKLLEKHKKAEPKEHKLNELFTAVKSGNLNAVKAILEFKPEILNERNEMNQSPLHYAARLGQNDILAFLMDKSEHLDEIVDIKGYYLLDYALEGGHIVLVEYLLNTGVTHSKFQNKYNEAVEAQNSKTINKLQIYRDILIDANENLYEIAVDLGGFEKVEEVN